VEKEKMERRCQDGGAQRDMVVLQSGTVMGRWEIQSAWVTREQMMREGGEREGVQRVR